MKVGIYDKYLSTMGGGEKHMGVLAEALSKRGHEVEIFTHKPVDERKIKRLNLDFSRIKIAIIPEQSDELLSEYTKKFDLFINSTYFSNLENKANVSAYLTFFPIKVKNRYPAIVKKVCYKVLDPLFNYFKKRYAFTEGIYEMEFHGKLSGFWTNGNAKLIITRPLKGANIKIHTYPFPPYTLSNAELRVSVNGQALHKKRILTTRNTITINIPKSQGEQERLTLVIKSKTHTPSETIKLKSKDSRTLGIFITHVELSGDFIREHIRNLLTKTALMSCVNKIYVKKQAFSNRSALDSYDIMMANSSYTQRWIKEILKKDSVLLLPPIDTDEFVAAKTKKNIILNVGRFFAETEGSHNKKHPQMIKVFKELCDEGLTNWEFHLCGGSHPEAIHQKYLAQVKKLAKGYPVFIHDDCPFQELKKLYAEAKIYWHAAGYGEDERKNPDKFEHFGMTTAEAMSAGAIPVVINKAGQIETVRHKVSGYRWNNMDELKEYTMKVANDEKLRKRMSKEAVKRSQQFSRKAFYKQVDSIFGHLKRY